MRSRVLSLLVVLLLQSAQLGLVDLYGRLLLALLLGHLHLDPASHLLDHVDDLWPLRQLCILQGIQALEVRLLDHFPDLTGREVVRVELEDLDCVAADGLVKGDLGFLFWVM